MVAERAMAKISIPTRLRPGRLGFAVRKLLRLDRGGPVRREAVTDACDAAVGADREALVRLLYRAVFGREVDPDALELRLAALARGETFADIFRDAAMSEEGRNRMDGGSPPAAVAPAAEADEEDRKPLVLDAIRFAYIHFLDRAPTAEDLTFWSGVILSGQPIERFLSDIAQSEEARFKAGQREVGAGLSDGEFLMAASEPLFGRGLTPTETVVWQRRLESGNLTRAEMIQTVVGERIGLVSQAQRGAAANNSDICPVLGTSRMLSRDQWNQRAAELRLDRRSMPDPTPLGERQFRHTGQYVVSMIASLYRGRAFIETFLENIVSQTLFDRSELIIVDADSPEHEGDVVEAYRKVYPNIVYKRINYRLGIYDAWNVGVEMARGRYLTNTNLDDLRRHDSIALQAAFLDAEPEIDVVYQDFFYSFDSDLTFEQVAAFGFKSELPILTPHNLQLFNSPAQCPDVAAEPPRRDGAVRHVLQVGWRL